jgi:predicted Zn-dependent protease
LWLPLWILAFLTAPSALPQSCVAPALKRPSESADFFTDEQENELGRVIDAQLLQSWQVIDDPALTGYVQRIGDRLQAHLPPSGLRFHYALVDIPQANAISLPGGYIYVSRKLAAFMRSEDELAAVLAHEMGHVVTHQSAVHLTRTLRELLNIDHVKTDEIFDRYNQLLEKWRKNPGAPTWRATPG